MIQLGEAGRGTDREVQRDREPSARGGRSSIRLASVACVRVQDLAVPEQTRGCNQHDVGQSPQRPATNTRVRLPVQRFEADELAYKPDSVPHRECGGDHPSGHTVAGCLKRPTRKLGEQPSNACAAALGAASWPCFGGVYQPPRSPGMLVRSYRTVSPLPHSPKIGGGGGLFSVALSRESPGLPLTITLLCEVRTFLDPPK